MFIYKDIHLHLKLSNNFIAPNHFPNYVQSQSPKSQLVIITKTWKMSTPIPPSKSHLKCNKNRAKNDTITFKLNNKLPPPL